MKKFLLYTLLVFALLVTGVMLTPDRTIKMTTKELAKEADVSPFLANFIVNTKVGRKLAYIVMKKELKNAFKEKNKEEK